MRTLVGGPLCHVVLDSTGTPVAVNSLFETLVGPLYKFANMPFSHVATTAEGKAQLQSTVDAVVLKNTDRERLRNVEMLTLAGASGLPVKLHFDWFVGPGEHVGEVALLGDPCSEDVLEKREKDSELIDFFQNAPIALHWLSGTGHVMWANQTELDTLGYTAEEYIGQPIMKFCPDEEALVLDIFKELGSGNSIKDVPVRFRTKSGKIVPLLIDSNVAYKMDESGEKVFNHTRCFIRDDTGRRVRQARMDSLLKEAERTRQLFDAYTSRTLHLVKTPCHVVQQSIDCVVLQLERLRLPEEPARVVKDASAMLRNCTEQMAGVIEMVNDAGDVMKFEQGAVLCILPTATLLLEAGRAAVERALPLVKAGAKVQFEHGSGPSIVRLDLRVLQRALGHLLRNAAEATPAGGVITLGITHTRGPEGERVRFEVRDTGRGLDATQSDVFRLRFYTPGSTQTGGAEHFSHEAEAVGAAAEEARIDLAQQLSLGSYQAHGIGLGLRLSYGLVHAMGGELRVVSKPGDTSCCFSLPADGAAHPVEASAYTAGSAGVACAEPAPASSSYTSGKTARSALSPLSRKREFHVPMLRKKHASSSEIAGSGLKALEGPHVLVVEDTDICATIICLLLKQLGCTTAVAENGAVALQMLRGSSTPSLYSIVLMDLRMPVMDGFEATRAIKAEDLVLAPIVAFTAEDGFDTRKMCDEIGFDGFYSKPTSFETLKALLKQHLGYLA